MSFSRKILAVALVAILLIAGASLALASSHGGVIHAGVNNDSGTIKIVSAGEECSANWSSMSWNQEGPAGADGVDGIDGVDGVDGADGVDGVDGTVGAASQVVVGNPNIALSTAACPAGTFAMGGGFFMTNDSPPLASYPSTTTAEPAPAGSPAPAWSVIKNPSDGVFVTAYAICAP